MRILTFAITTLFIAACSSDDSTTDDGGGDGPSGKDATMMGMDSAAKDTGVMDTGKDSTTGDSSSDSSIDAPADVINLDAPSDVISLDASHCSDKVKDVDETDVDCGGPTCAKCGAGLQCMMNSDCQSNNCKNNKTCQ
jgi:hypothetical protein